VLRAIKSGRISCTRDALGAWLRARKLWCEVTGEPLRW
jgi:hypothetical protein